MAILPGISRAPKLTLCALALSGLFVTTGTATMAYAAPTTPSATPTATRTGMAAPASRPANYTAPAQTTQQASTTPAQPTASASASTSSTVNSAQAAASPAGGAATTTAARPTACHHSPVTDPMNVTITPDHDVRAWEVMSVTFQGQITNGHCAGDSFSFQIPTQLSSYSNGTFNLTDPANPSAVVAVMTVQPSGLVTVALTDYVETHQNVWLKGWLNVQNTGTAAPGSTQIITWSINGKAVNTPVVYAPCDSSCAGVPDSAAKWGQVTENGTIVESTVQTPQSTGAGQVFTVTDTLTTPGQAFDCGNPDLGPWALGFTTVDAWGNPASQESLKPTVVKCSPTAITVAATAASAHEVLRFTFDAKVTDASVASFSDHADISSPVGTTGTEVVIKRPSGGGVGQGDNYVPQISIVKNDTAGNTGDDAAKPVQLGNVPGATGLVMTITNTGTEPLTNLLVSDASEGSGAVSDLVCVFPDGTKGLSWNGTLAVGASFTCHAQLSGVTAVEHSDTASVTGIGAVTGIPVQSTNPYHAVATEVPATSTPTTPAPTPTQNSLPNTGTGATTTAPATASTTTTTAPATQDSQAPSLPNTGGQADDAALPLAGLALLAAGGLGARFGLKRRQG